MVTYAAAPGERNDVTASAVDGVVTVRDAGARVTGCERIDANTARCTAPASEPPFTSLRLGDGDDIATVTSLSVDGGAGDDTVTGTGGMFTGGPGFDVLTATGQAAFADGDAPGPDRYVGDPANPASLGYGGREHGVRLDLRRAGTTVEGDFIANVDSADGGSGDDVLIGDERANSLSGGRGADRLVGLGGNDKLYTDSDHGGYIEYRRPAERDIVEAGPGNDDIQINEGDRVGNVLRCGAGRDTVSQAQRRDFVRGDCETVWIDDTLHEVRLRTTVSRFLTDAEVGPHVARAGRHVVARGRRGLTLDALGRRMLRERGRMRITVEVRDRDGLRGFRTELQRM